MSEVFIEEKKLTSTLAKEFFVSFALSGLKDKVNEKLKTKQKTAKLPGFRDGQVPFFIIEQKYRDSVMKEAIRERAEEVIEELVKPYKSNMVGNAEVKDFKNPEDKKVEFKVCFELFPAFEMPDFSKIEIEQYSIDISDKDIDERLKNLSLSKRVLQEGLSDIEAAKGDIVTVDFESKIDNQIHKHGEAKGYRCEIGKGALLDEFENKLIGAKKGSSIQFEMRFPDDYAPVSEIAGKTANVSVIVNDVQRYGSAPEIDDQFAQSYGCFDLNELRYKVGEITRENLEAELFIINKTRLFDALESMLTFEVPSTLFAREYESLKNNAALKEQLGYDEGEYSKYCEKLALRKLRIGILIADYARLHKIQVSEKEFQNHVIAQIDKQPERKEEIFEYYKKNASVWYSGEVEERTVKRILSQEVKLIDVEKSIEDVKEIILKFAERKS